jgi:hypothetical protein
MLKAIRPKIVFGTPTKLDCAVFMTDPQLMIGLILQLGLKFGSCKTRILS